MRLAIAAPVWVQERCAQCKFCPEAEVRRGRDGRAGVALGSRCRPSGRTVRQMIENPDSRCPLGRFGRAIIAPGDVGRLRHDGKRVTGWSGATRIVAPTIRVRRAKPRGNCGDCDTSEFVPA